MMGDVGSGEDPSNRKRSKSEQRTSANNTSEKGAGKIPAQQKRGPDKDPRLGPRFQPPPSPLNFNLPTSTLIPQPEPLPTSTQDSTKAQSQPSQPYSATGNNQATSLGALHTHHIYISFVLIPCQPRGCGELLPLTISHTPFHVVTCEQRNKPT